MLDARGLRRVGEALAVRQLELAAVLPEVGHREDAVNPSTAARSGAGSPRSPLTTWIAAAEAAGAERFVFLSIQEQARDGQPARTSTNSGSSLGRHSRPPFLKLPTSSFFLVSTEITGVPCSMHRFAVPLMCSNCALRSGCCAPSTALLGACRL